jgi:hypothetical protein
MRFPRSKAAQNVAVFVVASFAFSALFAWVEREPVPPRKVHRVNLIDLTPDGTMLLYDPNTGQSEWITTREAVQRWKYPLTIEYGYGSDPK